MANINVGLLLMLLGQLCLAIGLIIIKKYLINLDYLVLVSILLLISGLSLIPILILNKDVVFGLKLNTWLLLIFASFIWITAFELLYFKGLQTVPITIASLTPLAFPFIVIALSVLFLGEQITAKFLLATALIIAGFLLLVLQ